MSLPQALDDDGWDALRKDDAALAAGVAALCTRHGLADLPRVRYASGSLPVYALGSSHVLKLFPPPQQQHASIEARTLAALQGRLPLPTPRLLAAEVQDGWHGVLMSQLPGRRLLDAWPDLSAAERDGMATHLGESLAALHAVDTQALADFTPRWHEFLPAQQTSAAECQHAPRLDPFWLEQLPDFLSTWMPALGPRRVLLHTEVMREHLMVSTDAGPRRLSGLLDFEPAMLGEPEYEFASVGLFVACGDGRFLSRMLRAYGYRADQLDAALQCRLMAHAMLHRYSNLRWYLERLPARGATCFEQLAQQWWPLTDSRS